MPDKSLKRIMSAWKTALDHLDATEPQMRELIESHLMDVADEEGGNKKVNLKTKRVDELMAALTPLRTKAVKAAFRHLRDSLPSHHALRP